MFMTLTISLCFHVIVIVGGGKGVRGGNDRRGWRAAVNLPIYLNYRMRTAKTVVSFVNKLVGDESLEKSQTPMLRIIHVVLNCCEPEYKPEVIVQ